MLTPLASIFLQMTDKVQIIHKTLRVGMWVTESEVDKFLAAGHKLAATSVKPAEEEKEKVEVAKKPTKKRK